MAFQHIRIKNTNVAGKVPGADKIDVAELCVNLQDHKLYSKDADGDVFELGASGDIPSGETDDRPDAPTPGDLFFDTTLNQLLYWDGSAWVPITGEPDAEGYVHVSGDNMTGALTIGPEGGDAETTLTNDGQGHFSDFVNTRDYPTGDGIRIANDISIRKDNVTTDDAFAIYSGGTGSNKRVAGISGEGSVVLEGSINTEGYILTNNTFTAQRLNDADYAYRARTRNADGTTNDLSFAVRCDGRTLIGGSIDSGSPNITLEPHGSASFSGRVTSEGLTSNRFSILRGQGTYAASLTRDGANYDTKSEVLKINAADKEDVIVLYTNGDIDLDGDFVSSGSIYATESITVDQPAGGSGDIFIGKYDGSEVVRINSDGSATFRGTITINDPSDDSELWLKNGLGAGGTNDATLRFANNGDSYISYHDASNQFMNFQIHGSEMMRLQNRDGVGRRIAIGHSTTTGTDGQMLSVGGTSIFEDDLDIGADYENPTISLKADGSAEFNGKLTSASTVSGDSGTTLVTKDYVDANSGGGGGGTTVGTLQQVCDTGNISTTSATFGSAFDSSNTTNYSLELGSNGIFKIQRAQGISVDGSAVEVWRGNKQYGMWTAGGKLLIGQDIAGAGANTTLNNNGSATFGESVSVGDEVSAKRTALNYQGGRTGQILGIYNGTTATISMTHDGTITAEGYSLANLQEL